MPRATDADYAEHASVLGFDATIDRLTEVIGQLGMKVFARIDHAGEAQAVGLTMPATVVLIYGNPRGGTPIMLEHPEAALDLPPKMLVRQGEGGEVFVAFHPIGHLLSRAGVSDDAASKLEAAQARLVAALSA